MQGHRCFPLLHVILPLCIRRRIVPETTKKDAIRLLFQPADKKHKEKVPPLLDMLFSSFSFLFSQYKHYTFSFLLHIQKKQNNFEAAVLFSYFFYLT